MTGGIATGKSTVSAQLKSFGLPIIDADIIARQVVEPGTPALRKIVEHFGEDILLPDGYLNRPKLGSIVFNDESQRKKLNSIVHPAVWRAMFWAVVSNWIRGHKLCILDTPLLIEGGLWKWVGKVVVVYWYVYDSLCFYAVTKVGYQLSRDPATTVNETRWNKCGGRIFATKLTNAHRGEVAICGPSRRQFWFSSGPPDSD